MLSHEMDPSSVAHQDSSSVAASVHPSAFGFPALCGIFHNTNTFRMLKNSVRRRDAPQLALGAEGRGCDVWKGEGSCVCSGLEDISSFAVGQQLRFGFNTNVVS